MELAGAGWAPAFAVLVHRHAPLVHSAVRPTPDPHAAVVGVFSEAMRQLDQRDAAAAVAPWLLDLAGGGPVADPSPLPPEDLDAIWAELHHRWPDGRRMPRALPWRRLGTGLALVAVAAIVPSVLLGTDHDDTDDEELLELRAFPVEDERTRQAQVAPEPEAPDFTFPEGPDINESPDPEPTPEPEATPEPTPTPEQTTPAGDGPGEPDDGEESTDTEEDAADDGEGDADGLLDGIVGPDDEDEDAQTEEPGDPEEPEDPEDPDESAESEPADEPGQP